MDEVRELNRKTMNPIAKAFLVLWIGMVVFVFIIVYWPPVLEQVANGLGVLDLLLSLQALIKSFFTAPYLAGFGG